jgi:hypothetical protein
MTERIYCGSDVIERDLIEKNGMYEYPDGILVDKSDCVMCSINCPKNPKGYQKEDLLLLNIDRYKTLSY